MNYEPGTRRVSRALQQRFSFDGFLHRYPQVAGSHATSIRRTPPTDSHCPSNTNSSRTGITVLHRRRLPGIVRAGKMDVPPTSTESEERARPPSAPPMSLQWHCIFLIGPFKLAHACYSSNYQERRYDDASPVLHIGVSTVSKQGGDRRDKCAFVRRVYTLLAISSCPD